MKKPQNENLIPAPIIDLVRSIYESKNRNNKETLISRLEKISSFCTEVLADVNKKK